ncbi:MAG: VIT family protein [Propionibacteriaceae bacterium]|jgi:VIT1/CCC1 family predicted Fe2+/Mn2+ transporter|nr:VIT family protein [Propionibacteriaceae bacterium]
MTGRQAPQVAPVHIDLEQASNNSRRLNWLRAGVLGANDGIVAISGLVIGVAAAGAGQGALLTAGLAGLAAGALSMATGEYVSVSTQRDTEAALIAKEQLELDQFPEAELAELAHFYEAKGLSPQLARTVAQELTANDALAAHAEVELKINHEEFTNPWHAAGASLTAFVAGSILPLAAILLVPDPARIPVTVAAATLSLALTGLISAKLGYAKPYKAIGRNVFGGLLAMTITYLIGILVGTQVG